MKPEEIRIEALKIAVQIIGKTKDDVMLDSYQADVTLNQYSDLSEVIERYILRATPNN